MLPKTDMDKLIEAIAIEADARWMKLRRDEKGWHAPEECTMEDDYVNTVLFGARLMGTHTRTEEEIRISHRESGGCDNCHTCMRPWDQKTDKEKELVYMNARTAIEVIHLMGYQIKPKLTLDVDETINRTNKALPPGVSSLDEIFDDMGGPL